MDQFWYSMSVRTWPIRMSVYAVPSMKCVPYSMYVTSKAQMVGARKKWRATTSQVTAMVIGMIIHAVIRPDQSATLSIVSTIVRYAGETSSWVPTGGVAIATRFLRSVRGSKTPRSRKSELPGRRDDPFAGPGDGTAAHSVARPACRRVLYFFSGAFFSAGFAAAGVAAGAAALAAGLSLSQIFSFQ